MTDADLIPELRKQAVVAPASDYVRRLLATAADALEERGAQLRIARGCGGDAIEAYKEAIDKLHAAEADAEKWRKTARDVDIERWKMLDRALAAEQERDRWQSNENLQMERAIRAESSLARLQAECARVAGDIEKWFDGGIRPDEWKLREWADKLNARTAPAQEGKS